MNTTSIFYIFLGLLYAGITIFVLGRSRLSRLQLGLIAALGATPLLAWIVFGLFHLPLDLGPMVNLGNLGISYAISEGIGWFLVLILPLTIAIALMVTLKKFTWPKRYVLVGLLFFVIVMLNLFLIARAVREYFPSSSDTNSIDCQSEQLAAQEQSLYCLPSAP